MSKAVGIDLGTTYSAIAIVNDIGRAEVIQNREGELTTPSVVLFDPDEPEPIIGSNAKSTAAAAPDRVVEKVKRVMGSDIEWVFDGCSYSPANISSLILKKLKEDAEYRLKQPVTDAVITVPAYFANREREATREAGILAGLNVLSIINEPTAAALAFSMEKSPSEQTVLVYDLGGGTFDVTVMRNTADGIRVMTTDGDVQLGGKDWDDQIVNYVAQQFISEHGVDPRTDTDSFRTLISAAESAKKNLSARNEVKISCMVGSFKSQVPLTREKFEELTSTLLERTKSTINMVLERLKMSPGDIDRVLLVGGSTRMPAVRKLLDEFFPGRTDVTINPDECVALGAALQATKMTMAYLPPGKISGLSPGLGRLQSFSIEDITAHSLGTIVRDDDDGLATSFIIQKDSPIPAENKRTDYVTTRDNQENLIVPVIQGESPDPHLNQLLYCFEFTGIPPRPSGQSGLEVAFRYDRDGIVEVEAKDIQSGRSLKKNEYSLNNIDDLLVPEIEPIAVVLAIDTSGSMSGKPLADAKSGAIEFLNTIFDPSSSYSSPVHRVGIVSFGWRTGKVVDLGADFDTAVNAVSRMVAENGTPMTEGISTAHKMLANESCGRFLVLLTDGGPNDRPSAVKAAKAVRDSGITLLAISIPGADMGFLNEICTPGIDIRSVTDTSQLSGEFGSLAAEISGRKGMRLQ
ncbi:MAG: Hsp70 family protein [bacterium]